MIFRTQTILDDDWGVGHAANEEVVVQLLSVFQF